MQPDIPQLWLYYDHLDLMTNEFHQELTRYELQKILFINDIMVSIFHPWYHT